jgi:hypothetical protein
LPLSSSPPVGKTEDPISRKAKKQPNGSLNYKRAIFNVTHHWMVGVFRLLVKQAR